ncbi:MAG: nucleoside monophosphate kinase [Candidatus Woesearchaeota archaeon]
MNTIEDLRTVLRPHMVFAGIGMPSMGKGTLFGPIAKQLQDGGLHGRAISTGEYFRGLKPRADQGDEEASRILHDYVYKRNNVPEEYVTAFIEEQVSESLGPIFFDGYPRTPRQKEILDDILASNQRQVYGAIYLEGTYALSNERRLHRIKTARDNGKMPRQDDVNVDIFNEGIANFYINEAPLVGLYMKERKLVPVSAFGNPQEVQAEAIDSLTRHLQKHYD